MDSVYYDTFSFIVRVPGNVVGIKRGNNYPDSCYVIIGAHFDSHSDIPDSAPGADDNASGVAGVLEAARLMRNYQFEHNIRFIAFSAEEYGTIGSMFYAWRAHERGDDIPAMYNLDMIGYTDALPESIEVCGDTFCDPLIEHFIACADTYTNLLTKKRVGVTFGDEYEFSYWGYQAIALIEDFPVHNTNPYYHTPADTIGAGFNNIEFCTDVVKASIASLASSAIPVGIQEKKRIPIVSRVFIKTLPNPFRDNFRILLETPADPAKKQQKDAVLEVYDALETMVKTLIKKRLNGGIYEVNWDGEDNNGHKLHAGIYFLRFESGEYKETKKVILLR
ncbi:MAG: M20/M25/M40 family metallo-hydrolase [candidate division WOR-3 bacterium]